MVFIPPFGSSPRTEELSRRVMAVIEEYRREHPDVSRWEIRRALRIVLQGGVTRSRVIGLAAGVVLLLAGFAAYYRSTLRDGSGEFPVLPFILLLVLLLGWVLLRRLR